MIASRVLSALLVPLGALLAAYIAVPRLGELPPSLAGLKVYAAHIAIGIGLAVSFCFGRSRTFIALAALALAHLAVSRPHATPLYHATTVAFPLAYAYYAWRPETSVLGPHGFRSAVAMTIAGAVVLALSAWFPVPVLALIGKTRLFPFHAAPLGDVALAATAVGIASGFAAWLYRREAASLALAAGTAAFALAARSGDRSVADLFLATAALVLAVAVLQDLFHMAFRAPLTGLLSRRALEEHAAALGRRYAIAMIDVDHFKRVNDVHGHDTGDQVLRMVERMLTRVGGARAYRYGGEEFALIFAGRDCDEVLDRLEALREDVAGYPFRLRSPGRTKAGRRSRSGKAGSTRALKVTVSVGVAQPDTRAADPRAVLAAADKALYRAKHRGRNTVCR